MFTLGNYEVQSSSEHYAKNNGFTGNFQRLVEMGELGTIKPMIIT